MKAQQKAQGDWGNEELGEGLSIVILENYFTPDPEVSFYVFFCYSIEYE